MIYDVLIVAHEKDYIKLDIVIDYIKKNVVKYNSIHLIVKEKSAVPSFKEVQIHNEQDVLALPFEKINFFRPNWIYQQMLKLLQNVTLDDYLVVDSDTIINKQLDVVNNNEVSYFFHTENQNHTPYFTYMEKYFSIKRNYDFSFISEIMFFNRKRIKELFLIRNLNNINQIIEFLCNSNTPDVYLSEFELYGNFITEKYKQSYEHKHITYSKLGSSIPNFWTNEQMQKALNENKDVNIISMHSWY